LLLQPVASPFLAAVGIIVCIVIIISLQAVATRSYISEMKLWQSFLLGVSFLTLVGYFVTQIYELVFLGLALFIFVTVMQLIMKAKPSQ